MAQAAPAPRPRGNLGMFVALGLMLLFLLDPRLRMAIGHYTGFVLNPLIGFGGRYPVLTILLAAVITTLATTAIRHFTTDWLNTARMHAYMRAFNKELMAARKENNTYKLKKLTDKQPEVMAKQQELTSKQLKTMPITMLIFMPIFAWLWEFLSALDYHYFTAPWNPHVDLFTTNGILFGTSVLQHWILLSSVLAIPLGSLVGRAMKYWAWKERWQKRHPDVHEAKA